LFDPGTKNIWINLRAIPKDANHGQVMEEVTSSTMAGTFKLKHMVTMQDVCFPAFKGQKLDQVSARVFDAPTCYDLIVGRSLLSQMGLTLDFQDHIMTWDDSIVSMKHESKEP